jgi:hypothetical protein
MLIFFISLLKESIIRVKKYRTRTRAGNMASGVGWGGRETVRGFEGEILRNEAIWKDPGVDGKINLKWLLNRMGQCGRD